MQKHECENEQNAKATDGIVRHPFFQKAIFEFEECYASCGVSPEPRCSALLGPSGSGKSTAVKYFAEKYPHVLGDLGWIRPVVVVEAPSNPSPKTLASEVLLELGDPRYDKGTEVQMTERIIALLREQQTRLLVFDEMQRLVDRASDIRNYNAAELFKRVINKAKIPTVVVGLEQTANLFSVNEQLRRRFRESCFMPAFDWNDPTQSQVLRGFLKSLHNTYRFENGLDLYADIIAYRMYCATAGLVGYIMAIVREAHRLSGKEKKPAIALSHLAQAYRNAVCGNGAVGVNPFTAEDTVNIELALQVVAPSATPRGVNSRKPGGQKRKGRQ